MAQKTDYLQTKSEIFRDKSAAEVYEEIKGAEEEIEKR